jgi:hypothetical protein
VAALALLLDDAADAVVVGHRPRAAGGRPLDRERASGRVGAPHLHRPLGRHAVERVGEPRVGDLVLVVADARTGRPRRRGSAASPCGRRRTPRRSTRRGARRRRGGRRRARRGRRARTSPRPLPRRRGRAASRRRRRT